MSNVYGIPSPDNYRILPPIPAEARPWFFLSLLIFFVVFEMEMAAVAWNMSFGMVLRYLWYRLTG